MVKSITLSDLLAEKVISKFDSVNAAAMNAVLVAAGVVYMTVLSQIQIPLGFTPIPLTMQTFGALSVAAFLGFRRSLASLSLYAAIGIAGAPVFAGYSSGVGFASFGYIVGMIVAGAAVGYFAEHGADKNVWKMSLLMVAANVVIYMFGVAYMMYFLGIADVMTVLTMGVIPFLVGDAIKIAAASILFPLSWRTLKK